MWMHGWLPSVGFGRLTRMLLSATLPHGSVDTNEKEAVEKKNDRSRAIHTRSGQRGASNQGWCTKRQVDAHSRQRTPPLAGKSLAGAYRPCAPARVGAL